MIKSFIQPAPANKVLQATRGVFFAVFLNPNSLREHSFFSWGGGAEEFGGGGSANFDMLQRGGSFYSFGINGGGHKNNQ